MIDCPQCKQKIPHFHFYKTDYIKRFKSLEDAYEIIENEMTNYFDGLITHGFIPELISFTGFKPEERSLYLDKDRIKKISDDLYEKDCTYTFSVERVCGCSKEDFVVVETKENFRGWIGNQ